MEYALQRQDREKALIQQFRDQYKEKNERIKTGEIQEEYDEEEEEEEEELIEKLHEEEIDDNGSAENPGEEGKESMK